MGHKNKVYIVSHKDVRGEVRWTGVGYTFVEKESGAMEIQFNAEVKLRDNDTLFFNGKWSNGEPEEMLREISMHAERFSVHRRQEINNILEEQRLAGLAAQA